MVEGGNSSNDVHLCENWWSIEGPEWEAGAGIPEVNEWKSVSLDREEVGKVMRTLTQASKSVFIYQYKRDRLQEDIA